MAEVEIHTDHEHPNDEFGRRVGVMVGIIGIILAVVTISSHRAHTAAVIHRTEANDQWSFFQSKKPICLKIRLGFTQFENESGGSKVVTLPGIEPG